MIELKPSNDGIVIEYPAGDSFKITLKSSKCFKEGTLVRFEISRGGGVPFLCKNYTPNKNTVDITLGDAESQTLLFARAHVYRLFFVFGENTTRVLSGTIKIK